MGDATTTAAPARSSSRTRGQALARRARDARRGARRRLAELGTAPRIAGVGLLVFVLTWPVSNPYPQPGLDPSWGIALHQAVHQGLNFGPDIVFTYGPLGFLRKPILAWPWTGRFAFAYTMAVHLALCISLVWAIRRSIPSLLLSALAALVVVGLITQEPILVIAFIWSAALVDPRRTPRQAEWLAGALGVMAGIELLAKFNTGVTVALLALAALLFAPPPRKRPRLLFAGGFALAAAIGWFATGQSLTAIPSFLTGALSIAAGYSEAMGYEDPDPGRIWEFWAAGAFFALGAAAAWVWGPRRARAGLLVLWAILCFTTFKAGFVRHDGGHVNIFFATIAGALCAFAVPARHRMVALLGALLVLLATFASLRADPKIAVHPWNSVKALKSQAAILSDGSTTNEQIAASRGHVAAWYGVDPETFGLIRDHTVHVDPVDAGLAWALRVRWNPAPIFQSYSAYTPDLDRRNADELADPDGPERILRDTKMAIDGRNPAFESPAMMRAMLCHFRSIRNAGRWQVLERVPNRCGPTSEILEVKARFGASVEIPDPPDARSAVVAQIDGLGVAGLESLRTTLYRAKPRYIAFDDTSRWRIVPGTAGDGLVLRVPNGADYPTPFTPGQVPRFLSVSKGDDPEQPDDAVTVRFLSLPIR